MHKLAAVASAFAVVSVFSGLFSGVVRASLVVSDEKLAPPLLTADWVAPSTMDGFGQGSAQSATGTLKSMTHPAAKAPELSLRPTGIIAYTDFTIGRQSLAKLRQRTSDLNWRMPASTNTAKEWAFIRREVIGPEGLDALAEMFDVDEEERPWSDTTTVHVLAPTGNWFVPFATVAHEVDSLDNYDRLGIGGGAQMTIGKDMTVGTELIYFGERLNDANVRETRLLTRLQIQF